RDRVLPAVRRDLAGSAVLRPGAAVPRARSGGRVPACTRRDLGAGRALGRADGRADARLEHEPAPPPAGVVGARARGRPRRALAARHGPHGQRARVGRRRADRGRGRRRARGGRRGGARPTSAAASVAAVAVADASALAEYPYTTRSVPPPPLLFTTLGASKTDALPGDEVDFTATVENPQPTDAGDAVLHVALSPGLQLLGAPAVERGPGCAGTSELACNLEFMPARQTTAVRFGVRVLPGAAAEQTVTAWSSAEGFTRGRPRVTIRTGSS